MRDMRVSILRMLRANLGSALDLLLIAGTFIVTYLPQSVDGIISRAGTLRRRRVEKTAAKMEQMLGPAPRGMSWRAVARNRQRVAIESRLARIRELHRRGWKAHLTISGGENLTAALDAGRGAILWRMEFVSSHILKRALAQAGHPVVHLTGPYHGDRFRTRLGNRVVGPLYRKAELGYMAELIRIGEEGDLGYLRDLVARLEANRVLSIFGETSGQAARTAEVLGRESEFATGAPALARRTGAALLPAYTRWLGPNRYEVVIGEPIAVDRSAPRGESLEKAVQAFAVKLEEAIRAHPESWNRWRVA